MGALDDMGESSGSEPIFIRSLLWLYRPYFLFLHSWLAVSGLPLGRIGENGFEDERRRMTFSIGDDKSLTGSYREEVPDI